MQSIVYIERDPGSHSTILVDGYTFSRAGNEGARARTRVNLPRCSRGAWKSF